MGSKARLRCLNCAQPSGAPLDLDAVYYTQCITTVYNNCITTDHGLCLPPLSALCSGPKQRAYETALARLQRAEEDSSTGAAVVVVQEAEVGGSGGSDGGGSEKDSDGRSNSGDDNDGGGVAGDVKSVLVDQASQRAAAQVARLDAAKLAYLSSLVVDQTQLGKARRGLLQAATLVQAVAAAAAPAAASALQQKKPVIKQVKKARAILETADQLFEYMAAQAPEWVREAVAAASFSSALQLIGAGLQLLLQRVQQQDAVARAFLTPRDQVLPRLLRLLEQVR